MNGQMTPQMLQAMQMMLAQQQMQQNMNQGMMGGMNLTPQQQQQLQQMMQLNNVASQFGMTGQQLMTMAANNGMQPMQFAQMLAQRQNQQLLTANNPAIQNHMAGGNTGQGFSHVVSNVDHLEGSDRFAKRGVPPVNKQQHSSIYQDEEKKDEPPINVTKQIGSTDMALTHRVIDKVLVQTSLDELINRTILDQLPNDQIVCSFGYAFDMFPSKENIQPQVNEMYRVKSFTDLKKFFLEALTMLEKDEYLYDAMLEFRSFVNSILTREINQFVRVNMGEVAVSITSALDDSVDLLNYFEAEAMKSGKADDRISVMMLKRFFGDLSFSTNIRRAAKDFDVSDILECYERPVASIHPVLMPHTYTIYYINDTVSRLGLDELNREMDRYPAYQSELFTYLMRTCREDTFNKIFHSVPDDISRYARHDIIVFKCGSRFQIIEDRFSRHYITNLR
jgi:hypothetical protein